jgi:uncharacterized membrane protein
MQGLEEFINYIPLIFLVYMLYYHIHVISYTFISVTFVSAAYVIYKMGKISKERQEMVMVKFKTILFRGVNERRVLPGELKDLIYSIYQA